jgi:polysaccharide pyruvyl transferase WcaK-like protein
MKECQEISIIGGSIWGNRGAEAMLSTTIAEISKRSPETHFNVYSIYPDQDRDLVSRNNIRFLNGKPLAFGLFYFPFAVFHKLFGFINVRFPLPKSLQHMKNSTYLLDMGGITFSDGRTLQLLYNVFSIWPAMLLDIPVVKLSQALGPFNNPLNHVLANYFLPKCQMIFARGEKTYEHLLKLNLKKELIKKSADIAFLYQQKYSLSNENEENVNRLIKKIDKIRRNGTKVISIIPSSLVFDQSKTRYAKKLIDIILYASQLGMHVIILPNASRTGSGKIMNNDIVAIEVLRDLALDSLPSDKFSKTTWIDFDINSCSIRDLIGKTDALVTSRFHGMVAGLSLCVPTMVIGWSHKYQETLSDFGVADYAVNYKSSLSETTSLFKEFWNKNRIIKSRIEMYIQEVKLSSSNQFNYLQLKRSRDYKNLDSIE